MKKTVLFMILALLIFSAPAFAGRILCASTTSTQNSGLFEYLLPLFQKKTGIEVHVVAVGTGAALEIGKRGDADVVLVHAKSLELEMLKEGYFTDRHDVMYNDFVIIGPTNDPLKLKSSRSAVEAFRRIAEARYLFVSRGDNSGTNKKELALWKEAGLKPEGDWYLQVGQGMAKTQRIANEKRAYTLTDRGTWLSKEDELDMKIAYEGDPDLFNQYGVMAVNPKLHKHVKYKEAMAFINWLISDEGQKAIANYKDSRGNKLFVPDAK